MSALLDWHVEYCIQRGYKLYRDNQDAFNYVFPGIDASVLADWWTAYKASPPAIKGVMDRGVGLPPEECSRVFEAFFRTDRSRSTTTGGTGMAVWGGGTLNGVATAMVDRGCTPKAIWASRADGELVGYLFGAPAFVNDAWRRTFPDDWLSGGKDNDVVLGGKGNVILLRYAVGSASTEQREEGFLEVMKKDFPGITLISTDQHAGATRDTAKRVSENLLNRFRGKVNGVFCCNESSGAGMLLDVRERLLHDVFVSLHNFLSSSRSILSISTPIRSASGISFGSILRK